MGYRFFYDVNRIDTSKVLTFIPILLGHYIQLPHCARRVPSQVFLSWLCEIPNAPKNLTPEKQTRQSPEISDNRVARHSVFVVLSPAHFHSFVINGDVRIRCVVTWKVHSSASKTLL